MAVAAAIALLAGGLIVLRGGSTPVPVDDVVHRYRAGPTAPPSAATASPRGTGPAEASPPDAQRGVAPSVQRRAGAPAGEASTRPRPAEGVYLYDTEGGESVDVFGGSRHTYPDTTTITVTHTGCGSIERWDALEERWDERETCRRPDGDHLVRVTSFHRFFSQSDERTMRCEGLVYPAGAQPKDSWTTVCRGDEGDARSTGRAIGIEELEVDGVTVRTLHVRVTTNVDASSDGQTGRSSRDVWASLDTGIVILERAEVDTTGREPVVGDVRYTESYEIRLRSLEPRR